MPTRRPFPRTEALRTPSSRHLASAQTIFCSRMAKDPGRGRDKVQRNPREGRDSLQPTRSITTERSRKVRTSPVQNPVTKMWDIYGIVTDINPHRRYFIRTQSGSILVRNRRFLRRRTPVSVHRYTPGDLGVQPSPTQQNTTLRQSSQTHHRPRRLIEEF